MKLICAIILLLVSNSSLWAQQKSDQLTWTFTYIKAIDHQKNDLKQFIRKNWFAMDSIAVQQALIKSYELMEQISESGDGEWDYIVAVQYFTAGTYDDVAERFEAIRKSHQAVKINNKSFSDLGKIIKSEIVKRHGH